MSESHFDHADQSEKKAAVLSASEAIELIFRQAGQDDEETEEERETVEEDDRTSSKP